MHPFTTPPATASTMPPPPPPPPPSNRAAPPPPRLRPQELPLPSALVPPKKRRVFRTPPKATIPLRPPPPPPPPPVVPVAVPVPTPPPPQPDHAESPLFSAQKPSLPPPPKNPSSPPPPPPPPPAENPSSPPPLPPRPTGKPPSPPPPPPLPPPEEKPSSPPPPPPPEAENPFLPPPPLPPAADEKPSAPPLTDAAAGAAPVRKTRKITRQVRTVIRRVPKGTIAARKAAAVVEASGTDGASQPGKRRAPEISSRNAAAATQEEQSFGGNTIKKPASFGGNTIKKPASSCNPTAVCEALLGNETAVCETLLGKGTVGRGAIASGPTMDVGGEHEEEKKLGNRGEAEDRAEVGMSERQRRRMTEVFLGGLNRDAKEEDVRAALSVAGEITEVRMIMDAKTKKNKGYCFVRYREPAQARKAIAQFSNVKICGKQCRVAALGGNDKIFLGNINKKWKKEDIEKLLQKIGVENIDVVTLLADSNNPGYNRGFAFLELETYRDALIAYRKLSRKDVFGKGLNIRVDWAEPLNGPDEKQMQKVKAVFVEGVTNSWDQAEMIFQEICKYRTCSYHVICIQLKGMTLHSLTALLMRLLSYLESFDGEQLTENGSKVNIRVSLAKYVQKGKKNMEDHKFCEKDKTNTAKSERILEPSSLHILPSSSRVVPVIGDKKSSPTRGLVHVLRELAPWRHEHTVSGSLTQNYPCILSGEKRPFSALGIDSYCMSRNAHTGYEKNTYATSSYSVSPPAITRYSTPYHHERRCVLDSDFVLSEPWGGIQMRQACSRKSGMSHDN